MGKKRRQTHSDAVSHWFIDGSLLFVEILETPPETLPRRHSKAEIRPWNENQLQ
jgi:hypothetical protein